MTTFLIIIAFLIFLGYIVGTFQNNKNVDSKSDTKKIPKQNVKTETDFLYKKREIKSFNIHGMHFQKNLNSDDAGAFIGYVTVENNPHDKYAVAVYNNQNKKLGYVPKGNQRLNESLRQWHDGKVFAWGGLTWEDYFKDWSKYHCSVEIPIGLKKEEIDSIKKIFDLEQKNVDLLKMEKVSTDDYFNYIGNYYEKNRTIESLKIDCDFNKSFPRNLIPTISKQLEKEKNWIKLIELEKYADLLNDLSTKFKETTLRRIEKAKENLPQHRI
jgi:hypothetical protein